MASQLNIDRPLYWTNRDSLWGGEVFKANDKIVDLKIKKNDVFRIEKDSGGQINLIPKPPDEGKHAWDHSKDKPVVLVEIDPGEFNRAYAMDVTLRETNEVKSCYLVETETGAAVIRTQPPDDPRSNGGSANLRR